MPFFCQFRARRLSQLSPVILDVAAKPIENRGIVTQDDSITRSYHA